MLKFLAVILAAIPLWAAPSPLESNFPDGYWDRETGIYASRSGTAYSITIAVTDTSKARNKVESELKAVGGTMMSFVDHSANPAQVDYANGMKSRLACTISYQVPISRAANASRTFIGLGRLIAYNATSAFSLPQMKEIDERIAWIEKEKAASSEALRMMPVSRALLDSKLKRLVASRDAAKASEGLASITVQISKEDPAAHPAVETPVPAQ